MQLLLPFFLSLIMLFQLNSILAQSYTNNKLGACSSVKLKNQESGFGIRYLQACSNKASISLTFSKGYFFKINEEFKIIGTSDFDLNAHYSMLCLPKTILYGLGGFNLNTRKWVGLYNNSYLKNIDLWGGLNAGAGLEISIKSFDVFVECKTILFNQGIAANAGLLYNFQHKEKKGKIIQARSLAN